ncbi:hypothetical protein B7494_g2836 [Chlorociboria aeruginascens]|nr:hypothetical protein B7494_g2836 [Chlorociboria aeruginascens]
MVAVALVEGRSGTRKLYKSRPDLAPPRFNITIPATDTVESGYIFVAPFSGFSEGTRHGPAQAAPYIFTDTGDLVWSGFTSPFGQPTSKLLVIRNYETIKELRAGNHRLIDKHEFHIINEETALIHPPYELVVREDLETTKCWDLNVVAYIDSEMMRLHEMSFLVVWEEVDLKFLHFCLFVVAFAVD